MRSFFINATLNLIKKILFKLPPEFSHAIALKLIQLAHSLHFSQKIYPTITTTCTVAGMKFGNPIGLAAGFDKNGDYIDALAALGFGFLEVGTVTLLPQIGNPKPRLFRLTQDEAIINRFGFNNKGVEHLIFNLKKMRYRGILGVNIGKNKQTLLRDAINEYQILFRKIAPFANYVAINISSPNTENLRDLQQSIYLEKLVRTLKQEQLLQNKYVPLFFKISPDLNLNALKEMADIFLQEKIDGVIATNTTIFRTEDLQSASFTEPGGLSGTPLSGLSTHILRNLNLLLNQKIPIIASGGIMTPADALQKIQAGAHLLQILSGFVYHGPALIRDLCLLYREEPLSSLKFESI